MSFHNLVKHDYTGGYSPNKEVLFVTTDQAFFWGRGKEKRELLFPKQKGKKDTGSQVILFGDIDCPLLLSGSHHHPH